MRILVWSLRLLVFVLLLVLAVYNVQPVSFHFFADMVWEVPLMVMLLVAFVMGAFSMGVVMVVRVLRLQRQLSQTQKQLEHSLLTQRTEAPSRLSHTA